MVRKMKFLTENDLRIIEKKEGLSNFTLKEGMKLTPSARGYLIDKGYRFNSGNKRQKKLLNKNEEFKSELNLLEAEFLKTAQLLLKYNKLIAKEIFDYSKYIKTMNLNEDERFDCRIYFKNTSCEEKNISIDFDDLQTENGKLIVELNYLKSLLKNNLDIFKEEAPIINGIIYRLTEIIDLLLGG